MHLFPACFNILLLTEDRRLVCYWRPGNYFSDFIGIIDKSISFLCKVNRWLVKVTSSLNRAVTKNYIHDNKNNIDTNSQQN